METGTRIKIQKWGNRLGIGIPYGIANGMSLIEGLDMNIQNNGNKIIIEPIETENPYVLANMLDKITENNIHHSIETGMPVGNEIW